MENRQPLYEGFDISNHNGTCDFEVITTEQNFDFVMIKAGGSDDGYYKDARFEYNYQEAKKYGLLVGCYYIPGKNFLTEAVGIRCANEFIQIIGNKKFEFPVAIDIENQDKTGRFKKEITDATVAFCRCMEEHGFYVTIYSNTGQGFKNMLDLDRITPYDKWVAAWCEKKPELRGGMWQYSSKGKVEGINHDTDLDYAYKDYKGIIISNNLNNYTNKDMEDELCSKCRMCEQCKYYFVCSNIKDWRETL